MRGSPRGTSFCCGRGFRAPARGGGGTHASQLDLFVHNLHLLCYGVLWDEFNGTCPWDMKKRSNPYLGLLRCV